MPSNPTFIKPKNPLRGLQVVGLSKRPALASASAARRARLRSCQRVRDYLGAMYPGSARVTWLDGCADDNLYLRECDLVITESLSYISRSQLRCREFLPAMARYGTRFIAIEDGVDLYANDPSEIGR
jgi:hypothetical protein